MTTLRHRPTWSRGAAGLALLLVAVAGTVRTWAAEDAAVEQEMKQDVLLRALMDELHRGQEGLWLEGFDHPYFIELGITDRVQVYVSAELGAVTGRGEYRSRGGRSDVRVGSYELDNSNFAGGGYGGGGATDVDMPIEDDYNAIRQSLWWMADRDYKNVVEELAQKKAFMASKLIEDKPPDFSHETPTIHFDPRPLPVVTPADLEPLVTALSAVFREYPAIKNSRVSGFIGGSNTYLVNTEGFRLRLARPFSGVSVYATLQADDGMDLGDSFTVYAASPAGLPSVEQLAARSRELAERLIKLAAAPKLENYTGPVLFDAPAATLLFGQYFSSSFAGGQRPVGSRADPDDFANKLNRRILPRFVNVVDDPTQTEFAGEALLGHYAYDDQGIPAQTVTLVEQGKLKTLLMSRNPSKEFAQSNGHGRSGRGSAAAAIGNLLVSASPALDDAGLKEELIGSAQDEGLEFALRVSNFGGRGGVMITYKVFPDGHEELVRGAQLARIDLKAFKRVLAAGDKPYVYNSSDRSVVAPALLFEELDFAKVDREFDKPPILPNPVARPQ